MRRESPLRPLGSVLEARPAEKSFLDARSAGSWAAAMKGSRVIAAALRMSVVRWLILVVMPDTLTGAEGVSISVRLEPAMQRNESQRQSKRRLTEERPFCSDNSLSLCPAPRQRGCGGQISRILGAIWAAHKFPAEN